MVAEFDGDDLITMMFQKSYSERNLPQVPQIISNLEAGNVEDVLDYLDYEILDLDSGSFSWLFHHLVQCYEDYSFLSSETVEANFTTMNPHLSSHFVSVLRFEMEVCEAIGQKAASPFEKESVKSNIPTLILTGGFDPVTLAEYGKDIHNSLDNSYHAQFPELGHVVFVKNKCVRSIGIGFVNDPSSEPNQACIAEMDPIKFIEPK